MTAPQPPAPLVAQPVPQIAAEQYTSRQIRAQMIVRYGGMTVAQAERHLRPWLAIACMAGANLPEIAAKIGELDELAQTSKHPMNPGELRWLAAEEICPRSIWAPVLARARDLAFDRFLESDDQGTHHAAVALGALARHLQHDINGHHVPPYRAIATRDTPLQALASAA